MTELLESKSSEDLKKILFSMGVDIPGNPSKEEMIVFLKNSEDNHLEKMSLEELRGEGKKRNIPYYYRMKKKELVEALKKTKDADGISIVSLMEETIPDLRKKADSLGIEKSYSYKKEELAVLIAKREKYRSLEDEDQEFYEDSDSFPEKEDHSSTVPHVDIEDLSDNATEIIKEMEEKTFVTGILDLHADGFGFLRVHNYSGGEGDVYVAPTQIRRFRLKNGDAVTGLIRPKGEGESDNALIYIKEVNGHHPNLCIKRRSFDKLTPIYPFERYTLEHDVKDFTTRLMDCLSPVGKGQRGLIVSQPKSGKTTLLKKVANSISVNFPESHLMVVLIDERPEEVTDMQRSVKGEVIYSTFDETPRNHTRIAELALDRGKRLVEEKKDVVILLDSLTRLARAYNLVTPPSGKTLSGGLDPLSLHKPKRFFGAARKVEEGGSLTILATALVETGSRMDDVIYEEFKGTGNMEIHLDRSLSERRIFPAIDIYKSGTRRDDLLLNSAEFLFASSIRQAMSQLSSSEIMEMLLQSMEKFENNKDLVKYWNEKNEE